MNTCYPHKTRGSVKKKAHGMGIGDIGKKEYARWRLAPCALPHSARGGGAALDDAVGLMVITRPWVLWVATFAYWYCCSLDAAEVEGEPPVAWKPSLRNAIAPMPRSKRFKAACSTRPTADRQRGNWEEVEEERCRTTERWGPWSTKPKSGKCMTGGGKKKKRKISTSNCHGAVHLCYAACQNSKSGLQNRLRLVSVQCFITQLRRLSCQLD